MNASLIATHLLNRHDRHAMRGLLAAHFDGVTRDQFDADLAGKNWALLLRDSAGRLVGFTTLLAYRHTHASEALSVIYSGDTIVTPDAWGSTALLRGWLEAVLTLRRRMGGGRMVWLLICSGYRTYRFLPVFWREFWPRFDRPMPTDTRRLLHDLAAARFGSDYDPRTGRVIFPRPQRLNKQLRVVPEGRRSDPHIDFFLRANPRHAQGDELVCITEIDPANFTLAGRRMRRAAGRATQPEPAAAC